jgi:hypothetical protein
MVLQAEKDPTDFEHSGEKHSKADIEYKGHRRGM